MQKRDNNDEDEDDDHDSNHDAELYLLKSLNDSQEIINREKFHVE